LYTKPWHNYKRLRAKNLYLFCPARKPFRLCRLGCLRRAGRYASRLGRPPDDNRNATSHPQLELGRAVLLEHLHIAAAIMFLVIWAIVGDITVSGNRVR
jgi:hypothetical protein